DPGPELHPRHFDQEQASRASDGSPRRCWGYTKGDPAIPNGDDHFWQGDIGTHGLHLLFQLDSDNPRLTVPVDEIVSEWHLDFLLACADGDSPPAGVCQLRFRLSVWTASPDC